MTKRILYYDREQIRQQKLFREYAIETLEKLLALMGDEAYDAWVDENIADDMPWWQINELATKKLNLIEELAFPLDRHWSEDPRYWAGGA